MAWRIEYDAGAAKDLSKLDRQIARRIVRFLGQRVAKLDDPRSIGAVLRGSKLGEFWKYRVGDYRIIVEIQDKVLLIYVLEIGDRQRAARSEQRQIARREDPDPLDQKQRPCD